MKISYKTNKFEKICKDFSASQKAYGKQIAIKLQQRINELQASNTFSDAFQIKSMYLHPLHGDREGEYAITLTGNWRLIVTPCGDKIEIEKIEEVRLDEVTDYH